MSKIKDLEKKVNKTEGLVNELLKNVNILTQRTKESKNYCERVENYLTEKENREKGDKKTDALSKEEVTEMIERAEREFKETLKKDICPLCGTGLIFNFCPKCYFQIIKLNKAEFPYMPEQAKPTSFIEEAEREYRKSFKERMAELALSGSYRSLSALPCFDHIFAQPAPLSPKFKTGDWIRVNDLPYRVVDIIDMIGFPIIYKVGNQSGVCLTQVRGGEAKLWEPKYGEKVIVVCDFRKNSFIGIYLGRLEESASRSFPGYVHNVGHTTVKNVIPFLSMEQYDKIIKGEK